MFDYHSKEWKRKRNFILKRDGYQCQLSRREGLKVEADTVESLQNKLNIKECVMMHKCNSVDNGYNTYYKKFKRKVKQQTSVTTIALAA